MCYRNRIRLRGWCNNICYTLWICLPYFISYYSISRWNDFSYDAFSQWKSCLHLFDMVFWNEWIWIMGYWGVGWTHCHRSYFSTRPLIKGKFQLNYHEETLETILSCKHTNVIKLICNFLENEGNVCVRWSREIEKKLPFSMRSAFLSKAFQSFCHM